MFAKLVLLQDLAAIAAAAGSLLSAGSALLPEVESVALEAAGLVRHLDVAAAQQFVADVKKLYADAMQAYSGNEDAIVAFVAAVKKLIADARS